MGFSAAKRAAHVPTPRITRMREEKNTAMPAAAQALPPVRLGSQHRPQDHVILQDQSGDRLCSIPLRSKPEMLPDQGCIKPRLSLWMLMYSKAPSSCLNDMPMSRQDEDSPLPEPKMSTHDTLRLLGKGEPAPAASALCPYSSDHTRLSAHERHSLDPHV